MKLSDYMFEQHITADRNKFWKSSSPIFLPIKSKSD